MIIFILSLIIFIHLYLLSRMIFFPYPELFIYPYLTQQGLIPYKQIFDQHFPGIMFFPINLASLGIDTPAEMKVLNYLLVISSHVLIFLCSKKVFKLVPQNQKNMPASIKALHVNLLFTIWQPFFEGNVLWIDSFSQLLLLLCFYIGLSLKKRKTACFFLIWNNFRCWTFV